MMAELSTITPNKMANKKGGCIFLMAGCARFLNDQMAVMKVANVTMTKSDQPTALIPPNWFSWAVGLTFTVVSIRISSPEHAE